MTDAAVANAGAAMPVTKTSRIRSTPMAEILFYEKPGCITNARQKQLLARLGHRLVVRDLLRECWTAGRLRAFFADRPVVEWFNPSAPRVRDGLVDPAALDAGQALALMLEDPLLIRRPLLDTPHGCCAGFDAGPVLTALGVRLDGDADLQTCSRPQPRDGGDACPPPTGQSEVPG